MGTPASYLPPELSAQSIVNLAESLGLPAPTRVEPLRVAAEYHSIYLLHYERELSSTITARANPDGSVTLVLRVSGRHLPRVKTLNEVGVMAWVSQNTTIPVPSVVRFSESEDNCIGHEFTLLERASGTSLDKIYDSLSQEQKKDIVEQLVTFLVELHSKPWATERVGGLELRDGLVSPGPALEETFWQAPDIEKYWPGETIESLNPLRDDFDSYVSYAVASLECYIHAFESHHSLDRFRTMLPKIRRFVSVIQSEKYKFKLNDVKYILAHKDLHFANIMCDPTSSGSKVTAILDWEFSGIVPAPRWNPSRAFLWNGKRDAEAKEEQARMEALFETLCHEKGATQLLEEAKPNTLQEEMQTAVNHIRAIVEVCPRNQAQDRVETWRDVAETAMDTFVCSKQT
ncbi:hypothetical protein N0V82_004616 [Gnomoniopsis sp. IMI 355080]|nr:hypothetical protein N0V82_004616 [Gnomoniopsis sp. IMI 355080]